MAKVTGGTFPSRLVGRRVRELREERGWSQAKLAQELSALGTRVGQSDIARLEKQDEQGKRPRSVTLEDLLALGLALDCPPLTLLVPQDGRQRVLLGGRSESGPRLAAWFVGRTPLDIVRDPDRYRSHGRPDLNQAGAPGLGPFLRSIADQLDSEEPEGQEKVILAALDYLKGSLKHVTLLKARAVQEPAQGRRGKRG